jgi:D-alanyl-D-alanine carboxypeptidase
LVAVVLLAAAAGAAWAATGGLSSHATTGTPGQQPGPAAVARALHPHLEPPYAQALASPANQVQVHFRRPPRAGLLFDVRTGRVLWERNPTRQLGMASLTKMMTALLVVQHEPPGAPVLISREAMLYRGSGVGVLPRGRRVSTETLLYGLMLPSGNDAAIALAQKVGGTITQFVAMMNARAQAMGLRCTRYSSPDGFEDRDNHTCAVDLAVLARDVLRNPRLARIVGSRHAILPLPIKGGKVYLYNNNPLLLARYPGVTGVKTGYTVAAGMCLVATARRGPAELGVVLLHSPNWETQARKLLDAGFRALHRGHA